MTPRQRHKMASPSQAQTRSADSDIMDDLWSWVRATETPWYARRQRKKPDMTDLWIPPEGKPVDPDPKLAELALRIFDAICGEAQTAGYGGDPFADGNRWWPAHRTAGETRKAICDALKLEGIE